MLPPQGQFARRLLRWYDAAQRKLPWRTDADAGTQPTAYHVLVSELMLQQTQVATVIPYFRRFVKQFPTIAALAAADEQDVLRFWQGLGYYSRARNLQAAARRVVTEHNGELPGNVEALLQLPGIGRYTAGAVASIAFNRRAPILDGNVMRVLCRLDRITADPRDRATQQKLWARAEEILPPRRPGDFNSAMMELGAMVCTPRSPQCLLCPVQENCEAFAAGMQEKIPAPRKAKPTPLVLRDTYCIRHQDRWLIEQRPATGRWAAMWQFVTLPADDGGSALLPALPVKTCPPLQIGTVTHGLTHRRYEFRVFRCEAAEAPPASSGENRRWTTLDRLIEFPVSRPHLRIAAMLREIV